MLFRGTIKRGKEMSGFKVRELAHGKAGDMTRVPSTMRAAQRFSSDGRDITDTYWDIHQRMSLALEYIRDHQGEPMFYKTLSKVLGYKVETSVNRPIKRLMKEGKIIRRSLSGGGYTYDLAGDALTVDWAKGDPRNGEVHVTKPVEVPKTEVPKTVAKSNEQVFVESLDIYIWEFIKQADFDSNLVAGRATNILREFSLYMTEKANASGSKTTG